MSAQGYGGIWISIRHRFGPRMTEWFAAAHTALWGAVLLLPGEVFQQPAWSGFQQVFGDEHVVGSIMVFFGLLRFVGLVVNGARRDVTPMIRQISAGMGCLLWAGISYCYASSDVLSTWAAIYPLFAIQELVNIHRAAHDQGEARYGTTG